MKFSELRSAEVIEGTENVRRFLDARKKSADGARHLSLTESGELAVRTPSAAAIVEQRNSLVSPVMPKIPDDDGLKALAEARGITWRDEYAQRRVAYVASDESVDSHGDIVWQNWRFETFEKNPVLPFNHMWDELPVGNAVDWRVFEQRRRGYEGPALWLLGIFATADEYDHAERVHRMVKSGMLRTGSVGFVSRKVIQVRDEEERRELGLGRFGVILDENELLEFSPVTLPSNKGTEALLEGMVSAKRRGLLEASDQALLLEVARGQMIDEGAGSESWREFRRAFGAKWRTCHGRVPLIEHEDLGQPVPEFEEMRSTPSVRVSVPNVPEEDAAPVTRAEFEELQAEVRTLRGEVGQHEESTEDRLEALESTVDAVQMRGVEDKPEPAGDLRKRIKAITKRGED